MFRPTEKHARAQIYLTFLNAIGAGTALCTGCPENVSKVLSIKYTNVHLFEIPNLISGQNGEGVEDGAGDRSGALCGPGQRPFGRSGLHLLLQVQCSLFLVF